MSWTPMAVEVPIHPVTVRMPEALHSRVTPGASAKVESALDLLLGDIALAGRTAVELAPGPRFEVQAHGGVCGCPEVLVAQARAYVTGSDAVSDEDLTGLEPAASDELLELVCGAVLSEHPRMLGPSHELRSPVAIDLLVEPAYLRELSCVSGIDESFVFMRDGLFVELGLPVPPIRLVPDDSLRPNGFALRIGHK